MHGRYDGIGEGTCGLLSGHAQPRGRVERGGASFRICTHRLERPDIVAFAAAFDPQAAHLDEQAARATPLRGLAASGWHTCALVAHHLEARLGGEANYLGMTSVDELRWLKPVRPGDVLVGELEWVGSVQCICEPELARRAAQIVVRNRLGEVIARWLGHALYGQPPPERPSARCTPAPGCKVGRPRSTNAASRPGDHFVKYFEDAVRGDEAELGSYAFDARNVELFERIVCGEPRARTQGRVKGWNVMAACMRVVMEYYERQAARLAAAYHPVPLLGPAMGLRWARWLAPVSIGDRISFRGWVEHKVSAAGTGRWGLLVAGVEGRNGRGELVVSFYPQFLLERRPPERTTPMP